MKFIILSILPMFLYATSLDVLIQNATSSHQSIKTIQHKIDSFDDSYDLTKNFVNPELSLSISDIQLNDISNRSLEPMQFTSINFKQKISYFGKRDAKGKKVEAQKSQAEMSIEELKVKLVNSVKKSAFNIWRLEQKLQIVDDYISLTKQDIELFSAYSVNDSSSHMSIMNAELTLSQLKIKKSKLKSVLKGEYKIISYLSNMEVDTLEVDMSMDKPYSLAYYQDAINSNKTYKNKELSLEVANADIKVKELASYVDPVVQAGYYHRKSFEDYVNIGIGLSLPIYGSEISKQEIAKKTALIKKSEITDTKNKIHSQISATYANITSAYEIYSVLQNESLPQLEHMKDLSSSSLKSGADLFLYIQMLEKKLTLDEQNIDAIYSYHTTKASLEALIGEIK